MERNEATTRPAPTAPAAPLLKVVPGPAGTRTGGREGRAWLAKLFGRDLAIVTGAVLLWRGAATLSAGAGPLSDLSGVVVGLGLGVCVFFLHEWGHFLGALVTRSVMRPARSFAAPFVFSFDSRRNSRGQFLAMSFGGWVGTIAAIWVAYALLPADLLATRVARGVVLVSGLLVVVIEIPLVGWALWSGKIPPVETSGRPRSAVKATA